MNKVRYKLPFELKITVLSLIKVNTTKPAKIKKNINCKIGIVIKLLSLAINLKHVKKVFHEFFSLSSM